MTRRGLRVEVLEDRIAPAAGPLVLMGIDAEDGGPNGHGPINSYRTVVSSILHSVSNGGADILVIGGGKSPSDNVTQFWKAIDGLVSQRVRFVNGAAIATVPFTGKAMIAVVSDVTNTPSGGLTNIENGFLASRKFDVVSFLDGGGGLLGFSSVGLIEPYSYLREVGTFTFKGHYGFINIVPTRAGVAIGVTDLLDVCCWHDEYVTYPSFLKVLAVNAEYRPGEAVALGGRLATEIPGGGAHSGDEVSRNPIFSAALFDIASVITVNLSGTNYQSQPMEVDGNVTVRNVAPTAPNESSPAQISFSSEIDPSMADTAVFDDTYDSNNDGTLDLGDVAFGGFGTSMSAVLSPFAHERFGRTHRQSSDHR